MPDIRVHKIAVTGAPGSAKTEFVERLKREIPLRGFLFFEELARQILTESPHIRADKPAMHREIYTRQVAREEAAGGRSFVTDRGTVDAFAFHPESMVQVGTTLEREYARYTVVIQLGSAAALGEPFYVQDEVRNETTVEALEIEAAIRSVWSGHPNYYFVAATADLAVKYTQFVRLIYQQLAVPY
jgi:predicted ATPase